VPLLTHLPSLCIHSSVSLGQSGFLAPARHLWPGLFFGSGSVCYGAAPAQACGGCGIG